MIKKKLLTISAVAGIIAAGIISFVITHKYWVHEQIRVYYAKEIKFHTENDPFRGEPNAAVNITACFDFMCTYCDSLNFVLDSLLMKYGKEIKVYEKPLSVLNKRSDPLARALLACGKQNKYWEGIDTLFAFAQKHKEIKPSALPDSLITVAKSLGLDTKKFLKDMNSGEIRREIKTSNADYNHYGITGVPVVFINGYMIKGLASLHKYVDAIEKLKNAGMQSGPVK